MPIRLYTIPVRLRHVRCGRATKEPASRPGSPQGKLPNAFTTCPWRLERCAQEQLRVRLRASGPSGSPFVMGLLIGSMGAFLSVALVVHRRYRPLVTPLRHQIEDAPAAGTTPGNEIRERIFASAIRGGMGLLLRTKRHTATGKQIQVLVAAVNRHMPATPSRCAARAGSSQWRHLRCRRSCLRRGKVARRTEPGEHLV
jgi:hypothetical protein